jgi:hypothetical protein
LVDFLPHHVGIIIIELVNGEIERKRVEKEKTRFCEEVIKREKRRMKEETTKERRGWKGTAHGGWISDVAIVCSHVRLFFLFESNVCV